MKTTAKVIIVVLLLVAMAFLPVIRTCGQLPPAEMIGSPYDHGLNDDGDEDPLFEFLVINFTLLVREPGKYTISGTLVFNNLTPLMSGSASKTLDVGQNYIEVKFNGSPIYKNGKDGFFAFDFQMKVGSTFVIIDQTFVTKQYGYMQFDDPSYILPTPEKFHPEIFKEHDDERIVMKNDVLTVRYYYNVPRIEWFYTKDNKSMTKFYCELIAIHGFAHLGQDQGFLSEKSTFIGKFEDASNVVLGRMIEGDSKIYGKYVTMSATYADILFEYGNIRRLVNITLTFLLTSGDRNEASGDREFMVYGGTDLKLDVRIDLKESLSINGIALEQEIWSESKKKYHHDFEFVDNHFTVISRDQLDDKQRFFNDWSSQRPQIIKFSPKYSKPQMDEGYYFWASKSKIDGISSDAKMTYAYMPEEHHLKLYLAFITSRTNMTVVVSDPGFGVFEDSNPSTKNFIPPEGEAPPSLLVTFAGWLSAIGLVILPLWLDFRRQRRKLRELEEEFGEEL